MGSTVSISTLIPLPADSISTAFRYRPFGFFFAREPHALNGIRAGADRGLSPAGPLSDLPSTASLSSRAVKICAPLPSLHVPVPVWSGNQGR